MTEYDNIILERRGRVGLITLNRPEALNALNLGMLQDVVAAATALDRDPEIGAIVVTGSARAFAAGADIKEMATKSFVEMYLADWFAGWDRFTAVRTPVVAAVAGHALGGGCELAMMCDFILAADTAKFGQPEIKLGVIPGIGGSQRLTRAVGKAKAMEMLLTGRTIDAVEAERAGLVSRIIPADDLLDEAMATAATIAGMSLPVAMMAKEVVNAAYETLLEGGIRFERRVFHSTFATADQKEGMNAFIEKRPPAFTNR
ncbi:enoyl-CoA hydratase [Cryobacterium psychrotolerans]|uniref:Probable enoyl-CoA hydratase echA8 n=1 Tax=Cryobacterium psychrotolerans TaxID=386301 RepID=A0A1G8Y962_9MICO|nr:MULTISPECIES: enoyl-CoA hydratase [Cryobacterium]TFD49345.1 enoyl-CoA hydratase [Cryobacterium sp. TMT1-2-1]TFD90886.1 enoyl-CoA hydratase [Cryobacterium psychrotolerans]SDJ98580.1 enoyl-CoA hydratase [Cryobacterium psychrotolerans]